MNTTIWIMVPNPCLVSKPGCEKIFDLLTIGAAARNSDWFGCRMMSVHISGQMTYRRTETNDASKKRRIFKQKVMTDNQ
jgi:hypothetical protein